MPIDQINITGDQNAETNVNWVENGEFANDVVFNRPIKDVSVVVNTVIDTVNDSVEDIVNLKAAQTGGLLSFTTYSLLDAYVPTDSTQEKSSYKVTNDSDSSLNGYYHWVSGTVYEKDAELAIGDVVSGDVDAVNGGSVFDYASAAINNNAGSFYDQFPNLYDDPTGGTNVGAYRWVGDFNPESNTGRNLLHLTASNQSVKLVIENAQAVFPSGFISAGALWLSKNGAGTARQLIIQFDSSNSEIERDTISLDSSVDVVNSTWFESTGVTLNPLTVIVQHYFDTSNCDLKVTNFCIADGSTGGMRLPYSPESKEQLAFLSNEAFKLVAPNLIKDPVCEGILNWNSVDFAKVTARWVPDINKNVLFAEVTNNIGYSYQDIPVAGSNFEGADTFSWSILYVKAITSNSGSRVFVLQQDVSDSELSRTEIGSLNQLENETTLFKENVSLDPLCTYIRFYIDGGAGADGTGSEFTDLCLRKGSNYKMGPEKIIPSTTQINSFIDSSLINGVPYGGSSSRVLDQGISKLQVTNLGSASGYRWYVSAVDDFAPTKPVFFAVNSFLSESNYVSGTTGYSSSLIYRDVNDAEISRSALYAEVFDAEELIIVRSIVPANTSYIEIRASWWGTGSNAITSSIKNFTLTTVDPLLSVPVNVLNDGSSSLGVCYASSLGNDNNDGTFDYPVLTFNKAAELLGGVGVVIAINDGVFNPQTIAASNAIDLSIIGDNEEKPHVRGGTRKLGWALVAGESNVWSTASDAVYDKWIWEGYQNDAATFIIDAERETQHIGKTHRLEHTKLYKKDDLNALKASTHGHFYDGTNLYIKPANVYGDIEDAWITDSTGSGITCAAKGNLKLQDLIVDFAGINVTSSAYVNLFNVETIGARNNGLTADDCRGVSTNSRFAGSGNDGTNFHNVLNTDILGVSWVLNNSWCHDSGDDGDSMHEHCVGLYFGGLYEYNQDRGTAPSYGSHTSYHNVKTKFNGYLQTPSSSLQGEGFGLVGNNSETGGYGTSTECHNCIDIGSLYGFANHANTVGELDIMRLYSCRSERSVQVAYNSVNNSPLYLNDCTEKDSQGLVKGTNAQANIIVSNANLVT